MTSDNRMTWDLILEVFDVLERHGYHESDNRHTGQAGRVIRDLTRSTKAPATPPTAPTSTRPRPRHTPSPDDLSGK